MFVYLIDYVYICSPNSVLAKGCFDDKFLIIIGMGLVYVYLLE